MLYTGRVGLSLPGALDITVKGQHPFGKMFAPTWDMVMEYKKGTLSEAEYTQQYMSLITRPGMGRAIKQIVKAAVVYDVYLLCYCPKDAFCHRKLLYNHILQVAPIVIGGGELS